MIKHLLELSDYDLEALSSALRSGRLSAQYCAMGVQRLIGAILANEIAADLEACHSRGFAAGQIAEMLEMVLCDRNRRVSTGAQVDVVTSGPDVPGVANRDTSVVVRELFAKAQRSVLIAGYAIYQGRHVFRALAERMREIPTLDVRLFLDVQRKLGDTSASEELVRQFATNFRSQQWPDAQHLPRVFYDPRSLIPEGSKRSSMHAKCIVVDHESVFVSSANFTEAAQERNIEIGLLACSTSIAKRLSHYFESLIENKLVTPVEL